MNEMSNTVAQIDNNKCTGCYSCMNICPKDAISMIEDERGFAHPVIDKKTCIKCGLCFKTCPVNKEVTCDKEFDVKAYSLNAKPDICLRSSSGGAFSVLAKTVLHEGGVVFGARSNGLEEVWHDETDKFEGLDLLRRSKYFQSNIAYSFRKVKHHLLQGRVVLFVGTPCQVAGLKNYLKKEHPNLYTCDLVCHGVPSKVIFRRFVKELELKKHAKLTRYYRDSSQWAPVIFTSEYTRFDNGYQVYSQEQPAQKDEDRWSETYSYDKDLFNLLFHSNIIQRRSCHHCQFCKIPRVGEVTLGDDWNYYWKVKDDPEKLKLGRSYILVNNSKGESLLSKSKSEFANIEQVTYIGGSHISIPPKNNPLSEQFFKDSKKYQILDLITEYKEQKSIRLRIIKFKMHLIVRVKNVFRFSYCKIKTLLHF